MLSHMPAGWSFKYTACTFLLRLSKPTSMCVGTTQKWWITPFCLGLTACIYKCPSVMNEGCHCYSQRRSWCQSAAESWTSAQAALDRPTACTALANSLPWWAPRQTCSFLPNATRPAAGADRPQAPGFWWGESGWLFLDSAFLTCGQSSGVMSDQGVMAAN